jgi:hypothetical protein
MCREIFRRRFLAAKSRAELEALLDEAKDVQSYPSWDFFRDAWIACRLANAWNVDAVQLKDTQWPDFQIQDKNGQWWHFEATEALDPLRRRGDEYKEIARLKHAGKPAILPDPVENWLTPEKARNWLRSAISRKLEKRYAQKCSLIIYLNGSSYGVGQAAIEAEIASEVQSKATGFEGIWVIWEGRIYPPASISGVKPIAATQ